MDMTTLRLECLRLAVSVCAQRSRNMIDLPAGMTASVEGESDVIALATRMAAFVSEDSYDA